MKKKVCKENMCTGCMACIEKCAKGAIELQNNLSSYNATINSKLCVECGNCYTVCQVNNPISLKAPIAWWEGWALNSETRAKSSSGGIATAIMQAFIKKEGEVCSCVFSNGKFGFQFAEALNEVEKFRGSKYVKSNPLGVYTLIQNKLRAGKKILFLGLPCQVAAVKQFIPSNLQKELITVDLICHGTPTPELLQKFLREHECDLNTISNINFRKKSLYNLYREDYKQIEMDGVQDSYVYSFLKSYNYTENCYSCSYAKVERVSDITLGDSWGTEESELERKKGISLVLCQSEKGKELLEMADIMLKSVNIEKAIKNNKQLCSPSIKPKNRIVFFSEIRKGSSYDNIMLKCDPLFFIKQNIKKILIKLNLWKK